jgi:hypothetical protein
MPTPKPKEKSPVRQPEEARTSGGVLAEENPPHEIELVSIDKYGSREVRRIQAHTFNIALAEAADEIFHDLVEEIKPDLLAELPYPRFKAMIFGARDGDVYTIEVRMKHFTKVLHVKKTRAIYYFGGMVVEGFNIYIPVEAVYHKRERVTYYEVIKTKEAVESIKKDLEFLMEEDQI